MAFTGDGSTPNLQSYLYSFSNPFQYIVWLKSDNLELYSLQNESNQYIFVSHFVSHLRLSSPHDHSGNQDEPIDGCPGPRCPRSPFRRWPIGPEPLGSRFTKHLPPRRSAESERNIKHLEKYTHALVLWLNIYSM